MQREAVHRCSGIVAAAVLVTIPGLQCITPLRCVLHCGRETPFVLDYGRSRRGSYANRTTSDVSAVADPSTGVALYDSYNGGGWTVVGGTSVATPIIASTYALAGIPAAGTNPALYPYADPSALNDVTSGSNDSCSPAYLCAAGPGYDGPTGLGTPDGVVAFRPALTAPWPGPSPTRRAASRSRTPRSAWITSWQRRQLWSVLGHHPGRQLHGHRQRLRVRQPGRHRCAGHQRQSTSENLALTAAPRITLSGTVRDGSGHGWPLSASISVARRPRRGRSSPTRSPAGTASNCPTRRPSRSRSPR